MTLYFISGLGADKRMFQKLSLPQEWRVRHLTWIKPLHNETLSSYCTRLSAGIATSEDFVLIGLSFGGIIAVELSKIVNPKLTILISSVATKNELPAVDHFFAITKLDALLPVWLLKMPNPLLYWFFGASSVEEKRLVKETVANTPSRFLKWAIRRIVTWKNEQPPQPLVHIHGTKDRLLPIRNVNADVTIDGGGHLMVYNKSVEMSQVLMKIINRYK